MNKTTAKFYKAMADLAKENEKEVSFYLKAFLHDEYENCYDTAIIEIKKDVDINEEILYKKVCEYAEENDMGLPTSVHYKVFSADINIDSLD